SGLAADDAAAHDDPAGDDADEGAICTLAASDLFEHRLTLIECHCKTFLNLRLPGGSGRSIDPTGAPSDAKPRDSRPSSWGPDRHRSCGLIRSWHPFWSDE